MRLLLKSGEVTEEEILHFCEEKLAKYKVPKKACFLEELPRNASKKLLRRELRQLAGGDVSGNKKGDTLYNGNATRHSVLQQATGLMKSVKVSSLN